MIFPDDGVITLTKDGKTSHIVASMEFALEQYPVEGGYTHTQGVSEEVVEPDHKVTFTPEELYESFTSEEVVLAKTSENPMIVAYAQLLSEGRTGSNSQITATGSEYQVVMQMFVDGGVLTTEVGSSYVEGIPSARQ